MASTLRTFAPVGLSVGLGVAVLSFALMFASAFRVETLTADAPGVSESVSGTLQAHEVLSVLATTVFLVAPALLVARRWPRVVAGGIALAVAPATVLMPTLRGFDLIVPSLAIIAAAGGIDLALTRPVTAKQAQVVGTVVPALCWTAWFALLHVRGDLDWPARG